MHPSNPFASFEGNLQERKPFKTITLLSFVVFISLLVKLRNLETPSQVV